MVHGAEGGKYGAKCVCRSESRPALAAPAKLALLLLLPFAITIPSDCTLVGQPVCSQGGSFAPGLTFQLTNALDLVIGTF